VLADVIDGAVSIAVAPTFPLMHTGTRCGTRFSRGKARLVSSCRTACPVTSTFSRDRSRVVTSVLQSGVCIIGMPSGSFRWMCQSCLPGRLTICAGLTFSSVDSFDLQEGSKQRPQFHFVESEYEAISSNCSYSACVRDARYLQMSPKCMRYVFMERDPSTRCDVLSIP
jgi:hypothetical protein